jgi:hypothetical protein
MRSHRNDLLQITAPVRRRCTIVFDSVSIKRLWLHRSLRGLGDCAIPPGPSMANIAVY